jgi:putative ABC transport system permease protein
MTWLTGWRLSLRLARRDALRSRGRSILVLFMIALPVLAVTAADVVIQTQDVSSAESLDRRLGAADARVTVQEGMGRVYQGPDPDQISTSEGDAKPTLTADEVSAALGGARLVEERIGSASVVSTKGQADIEVTEVDLRDPATHGLFDLTSGRWPTSPGEVVVNAALTDKGYAVGDVLETPNTDVPDPTIVGIAESKSARNYPIAAGPIGSLAVDTYGGHTWLVDGDPVTWAQVQALNLEGATVLSRAVVLDPPPIPPEAQQYIGQTDNAMLAVVVLVVVMALIEVVLLAGPAFAVGARRQSRSLALMAATGGTPAQSRRVVMAGAVVLGGAASIIGVVLGIGVGWLLVPILQHYSDSWFGPFDVPWVHLVGVAAFGLLSAFLASAVPALIASRQDVVAVLAGRRGDRRPSLRSPLLGLVLLGAGIAGAAYGAKAQTNGEFYIAGAAIVAVLGMILLVPVVLVLVSRLSARLPLTLRYAARDAARHRSRTVPAVAAVAATVAGVVALGIATSSDERQNEAQYTPTLTSGAGLGTGSGDWSEFRSVVEREIPGAAVEEVRGLPYSDEGFHDVSVGGRGLMLLESYGSSFGADLLVSDGALPAGMPGVSEAERRAAAPVLAAGGIVAFTNQEVDADRVRFAMRTYDNEGKPTGKPVRAELDALLVQTGSGGGIPQAVLSEKAAGRLGLPVEPVGMTVVGADISKTQEQDVSEALADAGEGTSFYVERGYQTDSEALIIQLVLAGLGAVLMLGGTLTATFLALSDARPDLATLSAVGAAPRTRRGVAAAYAMVVGLVGALLGVLVGFIPGVAVSYPLTVMTGGSCFIDASGSCTATEVQSGPYLDVPWLMIIGVVVVLPLLTALIVGLAVRSRLPLVARLD